MLKISIPKPCHENWDEMTPKQQGRFCGSCAKTVVDFTSMSDEEVQHYLISRSGERTCGRFHNTQLSRIVIKLPRDIFQARLPYWKKFLAACLLVFSTTLFSCDTKTVGEPLNIHAAEKFSWGTQEDEMTVGKIAVPVIGDTTVTPVQKCNTIKGDVSVIVPPPVMGEMIMEPVKQPEPEPTVTMGIVAPREPVAPPKKDSANCNNKPYY